MIHGRLLVDPADDRAKPAGLPADGSAPGGEVSSGPVGAEVQDAEAQARRAQIADLTRRLVVGLLLTAPVALAVMLTEGFGVA